MEAKIYTFGNEILVSFRNIGDAEALLETIVKVVSKATNNEVALEEVPDLEVPEESVSESMEDVEVLFADAEAIPVEPEECKVEEPEIRAFTNPYFGMTPREIIEAGVDGFCFLCDAIRHNKVPACYRDETKQLVAWRIETWKMLNPPYDNVNRMINYIKLIQRTLGNDAVPDMAFGTDDEEFLTMSCKSVREMLEAFYNKIKP